MTEPALLLGNLSINCFGLFLITILTIFIICAIIVDTKIKLDYRTKETIKRLNFEPGDKLYINIDNNDEYSNVELSKMKHNFVTWSGLKDEDVLLVSSNFRIDLTLLKKE